MKSNKRVNFDAKSAKRPGLNMVGKVHAIFDMIHIKTQMLKLTRLIYCRNDAAARVNKH